MMRENIKQFLSKRGFLVLNVELQPDATCPSTNHSHAWRPLFPSPGQSLGVLLESLSSIPRHDSGVLVICETDPFLDPLRMYTGT